MAAGGHIPPTVPSAAGTAHTPMLCTPRERLAHPHCCRPRRFPSPATAAGAVKAFQRRGQWGRPIFRGRGQWRMPIWVAYCATHLIVTARGNYRGRRRYRLPCPRSTPVSFINPVWKPRKPAFAWKTAAYDAVLLLDIRDLAENAERPP